MPTSHTIPKNPHIMPSDAARLQAAQRSGERLGTVGAWLGRGFSQFICMIDGSHAHRGLRQLARDSQASRPELAAALRQASRRSWMD